MVPIGAIANLAESAPKLTQLKKACDGMEASFLRQLLSTMRESVHETKLGGDDTGMDDYKSMADGAVADQLAKRGTIGISKMAFHATATQVMNARFNKVDK